MLTNNQKTSSTEVTEIVLPGLVEPAGLQVKHRTLLGPAHGQALVQIEATGVSFAEQGMRRGRYPGQPSFPFVPGYDLVGTVRAVGQGVSNQLIGTRVAAVTKIGGWATHALIEAETLVPVPSALDPALVETVLVNGITAWQMLYRKARVKAGQTILVHGANGGVGTVLSQIALDGGIRVIGTASPRHHDNLRSIGVEPVDYNAPDLAKLIRALAPNGVDAAFDHLGLDSARMSLSLLARGGSLIAYGNAAILNGSTSMVSVFVTFLSHLMWWNIIPNSHYATFYNFWGGSRITPKQFRRRLREDLTALLDLLVRGAISPPIAARFPLTEASAAMVLAESRTVQGKVVLIP
ncbi:MAG TPA: medium chain dehydrogenase/reductase family protein [Terracidiphilus sp.]|jgi:NADPH2:quinone reductase